MKHLLQKVFVLAVLHPLVGQAQVVVDRDKYPDYSVTVNPDPSLMTYGAIQSVKKRASESVSNRPDHVNNASSKFFPPVFNQDGGSCGSASRICYMFTHELNAYRNLDGSLLSNNYPSHFVWLLTFGNSGKDEFVQHVGVPSSELYGGRTYSALYGYQEADANDFGWMTGYDKWYAGMFNRMLRPSHFSEGLNSEAGREAVKNWLWNHNGDSDFHGGGIVGIGVASGGDWKRISKTAANDEAGVTGMYYVNHWGTQVDHALTIVGYDDRVEFDLNGNGIFGEESADEKGAWIIVNSWGSGWCNGGTIYCPYAYAGSYSICDEATKKWSFSGAWWYPEVYSVRKNYRPLRTIKLLMDYSRRSELHLSAGVSADVNATEPDKTVAFEHFKYAGDGANGNTNPAPEIPMLGRWADGKLHDEPMEFGYDLTDLTEGFDKSQPLKYFFIVDTREWGLGSGHIRGASIMDYDEDPEGVELPFDLGETGVVEIKSAGTRTMISMVVQGQQYYAPTNATFTTSSLLAWQAPQTSRHEVTAYNIRKDGLLVASLEPDVLTFDTQDLGEGVYSITAVYEGNRESASTSISSPVVLPTINQVVNFKKSGFTIPDVFTSKMNGATLEFWINPNSLSNWNQSAGPGWGQFMLHANSDGSFTAGWNTSAGDRCSTPSGSLVKGSWTHVAIVVNKNTLTTYINGREAATCTSSSYSGMGGFGDLVFSANTNSNSNTDAILDEIRIWNYARSAEQISADKGVEFSGELLPDGLLAYYKGAVFEQEGTTYMRDYSGGHHACILNSNFTSSKNISKRYTSPTDKLAAEINLPTEPVYAGVPVTLTATRSESACALAWTAENAGVKDVHAATVTLLFKQAGEQEVRLVASNSKGSSVETVRTINVQTSPAPEASFTPVATEVSVGERVSFIVDKPQIGYFYDWTMEGADVEKSSTINAAATYSTFGEYTVTLTVTAPDGRKTSFSRQLNVIEVAPKVDFAVTPAVVQKGNTTFLQDNSKWGPTSWKWYIHSTHQDYVVNGRNFSFAPEVPGVYDVTLYASNGAGTSQKTGTRSLIVVNADSKNGLNFSQSTASVTATTVPFTKGQRTFAMDWWMRPSKLTNFCQGIGEKESTFLVRVSGNGAMIVDVNSKEVYTNDGFVIAGQWHHYAVTFSSGTVKFFRDGVLMASRTLSGAYTLPAVNKFSIGVSGAEMNGSIDEFRVWGSNLGSTDNAATEKLRTYINQPLDEQLAAAEENDKLKLYYQFNQNGGDVQDMTSNGNTGVRSGFGPDGDAWGLSKGVFCLNFDEQQQEDVTAEYLHNYKKPFSYDKTRPVNPNNTSRWYAINDWTVENTVTSGSTVSGVHVDLQKSTCFTATSGWDGFAGLADHKAFQTVTLPAGAYTFSATYDATYEGQCGGSYLVVAEGESLPNTADLSEQALSYVQMQDKSVAPERCNSVVFFLSEPTTVSLGLVVNMTGNKLMALEQFSLLRSNVITLEADNVTGYDLAVSENGLSSLYLPYPVVLPDGVTAYVASEINESKHEVALTPITDRILPARTGALIQTTAAGTYHFAPTESEGTVSSLFAGVLSDTEPEAGVNYMVPGSSSELSFVNLSATGSATLPANRIYFTTTQAADAYTCRTIPVGIGEVTVEQTVANEAIYDLFGRRLTRITKPGVYVVKGKKILVK